MGRLAIVWEGETVGYMEEPMPDMYYLEGKWVPSDSPKTKEFLRATQGLDVRKNMPGGSEDYTRLSERRAEFEVVGTLAERGRAVSPHVTSSRFSKYFPQARRRSPVRQFWREG